MSHGSKLGRAAWALIALALPALAWAQVLGDSQADLQVPEPETLGLLAAAGLAAAVVRWMRRK